jgi:hypothetical protein
LKHYRDRKFPLAMGAFGMVLEIDKADKSANLHLDRCQYWLKNRHQRSGMGRGL